MFYQNKIWIGTGSRPVFLDPMHGNMHGLISGATGTGKTMTMKVLAEGFSSAGIPVVISDIKGNLSGVVRPGVHSERMAERLADCGVPTFCYRAFATDFWDAFGEGGHPMRATAEGMGPLLLARILGINEIQAEMLTVCFSVAKREGLAIFDLRDLKAMLEYISAHSRDLKLFYGTISTGSIGAIRRAISTFESQGGNLIFGEPAFNAADFCMRTEDGEGIINIIDCRKLYRNPAVYSTYLFWLLCRLNENLPDTEDERPRVVFFFDDAHLLFRNCSTSFTQTVVNAVRMIRKKGVSVFFSTNNPMDVPSTIINQTGLQVTHCLHAFTPQQLKDIRLFAQSFRSDSELDTVNAITSLRDGEAIISLLDKNGVPSPAERVFILPDQSNHDIISPSLRQSVIEESVFSEIYK